MSRYQKGKTNLDFTEARDSEWQWNHLGHMQICTLLQTAPHHSVFLQAGRPSCHPTNSVKALKGKTSDNSYLQLQIVVLCSKIPSLEHLYNSIKSVRLGYQSLIFFNTFLFKKQSALSLFLYLHSKQNLKFSVLLVKISKMYTVHSVIIWDKENRCSNLHWSIST